MKASRIYSVHNGAQRDHTFEVATFSSLAVEVKRGVLRTLCVKTVAAIIFSLNLAVEIQSPPFVLHLVYMCDVRFTP